MLKTSAKIKPIFPLFCVVLAVLAGSLCWAGEQLDKTRYITIDEVRPGMQAYCLTAYNGTEIEKFDLEILSVVRNINPGGDARPGSRDAILVQGTDERFIHTGPVSGCSGSPVYIDGRLAGALAFGWIFSKDPLYGVTPIEEMLRVGEGSGSKQPESQMAFLFDFSRPIDFAEIDRRITTALPSTKSTLSGASALPCPLITSGLPDDVCRQLQSLIEPFGFMAVAGIGGGAGPGPGNSEDVQLVPGACLAVPLVTGDITMTAIGTVTEVMGDDVYGFGHSFLGYGAIDLPMATGQVHTVVSSLYRSFKFASAIEIVGALTMDESTAVRGRIGAKAKMIPLTIKVDHYVNDRKQVYDCQVANNRLFTPLLLRAALAGAALMPGDLPPDHTIEYKVSIGIEAPAFAEVITFENVSTSLGLTEMIIEGTIPVAILLNNPYKKVDIKSVEYDIRIKPKNITSHIWSVDLSDSKIKAGETVEVSVVIEPFMAEKKKYSFDIQIPKNLEPGRYELMLCGGYNYHKFLVKNAPYKFLPQSLPSLIEAINNTLSIKRNRLYCILSLPPAGVVVENAQLPDLPDTIAMVLLNPKRNLKAQLYRHWIEKTVNIGCVISDEKIVKIEVIK